MSRVNVPLLRKAVEWVEEQEALPTKDREWFQGQWFCGSKACVAGQLALMEGWTPVWSWEEPPESEWVERGGECREVVDVARELLGIEGDTGLFHGVNTAADIRRIAEQLAGERL